MPETLARMEYQELFEAVDEVVRRYGEDMFQRFLTGFQDHMEIVGKLNSKLADATLDTEEYDSLVSEIMEATQAYYTYIGAMPQEIRSVLLQLADLDVEDVGELDLPAISGGRLPDASPLLSAQAIRPKNYIMQVDAVTNHLAQLGGQSRLNVGRRGSRPVKTTVTLDMPDHMRIEGGHALSTYDKSIINGVTSLIESGNTYFSIPMLYHAMTGKQNPTVDEALADELSGKLEKMRRMILSIDLTEESEARVITNEDGEQLKVEELQIEGYLLPLNRVSGTINGKRAELYQVIQHPPIYTYSKMKRQLASVPISLLSAPINNNSTTIPLKTYLLQRIEMMKNKKNSIVSQSILYDTVYHELGAEEANKTRRKRIRTYTATILNYFVEQDYIKGWVEYKKGRTIAGIHIEL